MSRNGKIAHLPGNVRDELNQRLENGQEGATLLPWLNALPEVQERLKDHFDGAPISKQNLSEWRQGGFREWQIGQELILPARQLSDAADDMEEAVDTFLLPGALAGALAARYAALLNSWDGEADPKFEEKLCLLRGLNRDIALLQKTMQQAGQQKRQFEQALEETDRRELEEEKKRQVAPIWAKLECDQLEGIFGGGEVGRRMAEVITAVKYDLPPPKNWEDAQRKKEEAGKNQAKSKPRRPTQSNPVKASQTVKDPVPSVPSVPSACPAETTPEATSKTMNS
jgi:uncharacterized protein YukE